MLAHSTRVQRLITGLATASVMATLAACGTQVAEVPPPTSGTSQEPVVSPEPTPAPSEQTVPPAPTPSAGQDTVPPAPTPSAGQDTIPPRTTPSPGRTTVPPEPQPSSARQTFGNYGKASFEHFTVELKPITREGTTEHANFQVEVCVVKAVEPAADGTTRVSVSPWRLHTSTVDGLPARPSTESDPAFPAETRLKVGECASGWIEFDDPDGYSERLSYNNSVGEQAEWIFS